MPVGRVYQPPPNKKVISDLKSPFLDSDRANGPVRRNFVVPSKTKRNNGTVLTEESNNTYNNGDRNAGKAVDIGNHRKNSWRADANGIVENGVVGNDSVLTDVNGNDAPVIRDENNVDHDSSPGCDNRAANGSDAETAKMNGGRLVEPNAVDEVLVDQEEVSEIPVDGNCKALAEPRAITEVVVESDVIGIDSRHEKSNLDMLKAEPITVHVDDNQHQPAYRYRINGYHDEGGDLNDGPDTREDEIDQPLSSSSLPSPIRASLASLPDRAKGLKNLGNTCFMNSIIQCLAHTPKILDFCQDFVGEAKGDLVTTSSNSSNRHGNARANKSTNITATFAKLVRDMWNDSSQSNSHGYGYCDSRFGDRVGEPAAFKREMGSFQNKFLGFDQHDSQEFLQYVLEGIHNELNRAEPSSPKVRDSDMDAPPKEKLHDSDDPEESGLMPSEAGRRCWRKYLQRDNSMVTDLFLGQFRSTLKCTVCDHESVTFEPFWVVSLPIPPAATASRSIRGFGDDTVKLQDCLDLFVKEETLDGEEKPKCEQCKTRTKCTKYYAFERWPRILVLHLKRFAPGERFRSKLSCHVDVPVENLDLGSYSKDLSVRYDLYGVSNHSGTLYGGHYTAYCRHPKTHDKWHLYNDRMVSNASQSSVISYEAYLLFFERREGYFDGLHDQADDRHLLCNGASEAGDEDEEHDENGDEEW